MEHEALSWPFLEDEHRALAAEAGAWCRAELGHIDHADADAACKALVQRLGAAGWLRHCVPGEKSVFSARRICLMRETLAYHDGLADFAFAMQGLGSGALSLFGSASQQAAWLPRVGEASVPGALRANTTYRSAMPPLEIQVFSPSST